MKNSKLLILSSLALLGLASCGTSASSAAISSPEKSEPIASTSVAESSSSSEEKKDSSLAESSEEESKTDSENATSAEISKDPSSSEDDVVTYLVTFDLNGGMLPTGESYIEPQHVVEGHWARKPSGDPIKRNCTFKGWYTSDGFLFNFMTNIYGDVSLIAQYDVNEDAKITIRINPNNGEPPYRMETFIGDTISLSIPTPPEGMSFRGWYINGNINKQFTGYISTDVAAEMESGGEITAIYEKSAFNYVYEVNEDGTATLTGISNINASYVNVPEYINGRKVTRIADSAFSYRVYLNNVFLPKTIEYVSGKAFAGARALINITVDAENPRFKDINGILYSKDGSELICCPQKNSDGVTFTVPSHVRKIGADAFYNQNSYQGGILGINFNEGLEEIGERAFYNVCFSATSLRFPSTLKAIRHGAFEEFEEGETQVTIEWNEGLEVIEDDAFVGVYIKGALALPSTVKSIGDYAFCCPQNSHNAITSVALPEALESFGKGVFYNCYGVESVTISARNDYFTVINNTLYSRDVKKLVWAPSDSHKNEDFVVDSRVEEICPRSMGELRYMNSVTLNDGLKRIDDEAFHGSYYLRSIEIPDSVEYLGESAFEYATVLSSVRIGSGVETIGKYCFADSGLKSIEIPGSVKTIGYGAFWGVSLNSVTFNEGLETIAECAFDYVPAHEYDDDYGYDQETSGGLTSLSFPNSLRYIGESAFANNERIDSITFGENIETIKAGAFDGAKPNEINLTAEAKAAGAKVSSYTLYSASHVALYCSPAYNGKIEIADGTVSIGEGAFYDVKATGLTLPSTLLTIGEGAFARAFKASEEIAIEIPASVTEIGVDAFYFSNIDSLTLNEGLKSIGDGAFCYCDGIAELAIPNSVESIGVEAFSSCSGIASLDLGTGVKSIGTYAFRGTTLLEEVNLPASVETLGVGIFSGYGRASALAAINVDAENPSFVSEDGAVFNKDKTEMLMLAPGYREKVNYAVPDSVTRIADYCFWNCQGIKSISFGENLAYVGEGAFSNCANIAGLTLPASVSYIGSRAFEGFSSSQIVTISRSEEAAMEDFHKDYKGGSSCQFVYLPVKG